MLWLGWRQVHEQRLKLYPCTLALEYCKQAGCVTTGAGLLGTGWCGGEREDWWRVEGGHAAVGPASTFAPMEKNRLWRPPKVSPFEKQSRERSRGEASCLYAVSRQQLKKPLSIRKRHIKYSFIVHWSTSFLQFLPLFSVYFNLLLNSAYSCTHFFSPTLLCPSHPATWLLWQRYTKWRRGAESWKAESGSHFLTDPDPGTERVKTSYA